MMGRLRRWLSLLTNDPAALRSRLKRRLRTMLKSRFGVVGMLSGTKVIRRHGIRFSLDFDHNPFSRLMFTGDYEPIEMSVLRRFLRPGSAFVDVGANIGYVSFQALQRIGKSGEVHCFEPVPEYCGRLREFAELNIQHRIIVNQFALGEVPGTQLIKVAADGNIGWNTLVPSFLLELKDRKYVCEVEVRRLDDYLINRVRRSIHLIKIDTEGYEFPVLKGLERYLVSTSPKPPILCEIAPSAYASIGASLRDLDSYMSRHGYAAFDPKNARRRVNIKELVATTNVLFITTQE